MSRIYLIALIFLAMLAICSRISAEPTTQATGTLNLFVVDRATDAPLEKATVEVNSDGGDKKLTTDADGHVSIPIPAGAKAYLGASAHVDGYVNRAVNWRSNESEPIPTNFTMKLERATTIRGKVVDDQNNPVAGAHVVITLRNPEASRSGIDHNSIVYESAKTADDGTWTYAGAPAEFDTVEIGVWHYNYASGDFFQFKKFSQAQARDGSATCILARGIPIEGVVVDQDDKPIKGARVIFGGEMASNKMDPQKTGDDGKFAYAAKTGDEVVLTVTCKAYAPELQTLHMGDDKLEVKFTLSPAKKMFGRVVGPDGEPVPNAWVYPDTWRGRRSLETRIHADKDGRFHWDNAPLDAVKCDVDGSEAGYTRETMDLTASDDELVVTLRKALHVTGTVVDEDTGKSIDKFRVVTGIQWNNGDDRVSWERQRSENKSRGGKIDYLESWARPGYAVRIEADGYLPDEEKGLTLDQGSVNLDIKLKKAENIKLTLKKPDGSPAAKVKAYLVAAGDNLNISDGTDANNWSCPEATSDDQGKIEFPAQTNEYVIVVPSKFGYAQVDHSTLADTNTIELQKWSKIEGTLIVDGNPVADAMVSVQPLQGGAMPMAARSRPQIYHNLTTKTDAQGKFSFEHVPPGSVSVSRREDMPMGNGTFRVNESFKQEVNANAGETATVSLGNSSDAQQQK
jgi:protocatechuate 3,4-dioxygenase beta subunit